MGDVKPDLASVISKILEDFIPDFKKSIEEMNTQITPVSKIKFDEFAPKNWSEYIGQNRIKSIIQDAIKSAKIRKSPLDHILLISSMPGQGKTSLARLIAKEMKSPFFNITASSIEKPDEIIKLLRDAFEYEHSIIFIDEIHRLKKGLAELLYVPMENFNSEITIPKFLQKPLFVKPFTLIGATAGEQGLLPKPLLDRFSITLIFDSYTITDLIKIIQKNAKKLSISINKTIAQEIAQRSLFTPRIAINHLKRIRDYLITHKKSLTKNALNQIFEKLGIDELGLDNNARILLKVIYNQTKNKGAVGLETLAKLTGLDKTTISKMYEPILIKLGLLEFTNKGRMITEKGEMFLKAKGLI